MTARTGGKTTCKYYGVCGTQENCAPCTGYVSTPKNLNRVRIHKMANDKKYNGWTNYETWIVALWQDNDEGSQRYWEDEAQNAWDTSTSDKYNTREQKAVQLLADVMKERYEEDTADTIGSDCGVFSDLLGAALSEVDWHEISEHLIEGVEKEGEEEEEGEA